MKPFLLDHAGNLCLWTNAGPRLEMVQIASKDTYQIMRDEIGCLKEYAEKNNRQLRDLLLAGADLRRLADSSGNLTGYDFSMSDLSGCRLSGVKLAYCRFNNSNLNEADLSHAEFVGGEMVSCNLQGAQLKALTDRKGRWKDCVFANADCRASKWIGSSIFGSKLPQSGEALAAAKKAMKHNFLGADFENAQFENGFLHSITLENAVLTNASFKEQKIINVVFAGCAAKHLRISSSCLSDCSVMLNDFEDMRSTNNRVETSLIHATDFASFPPELQSAIYSEANNSLVQGTMSLDEVSWNST